MPLEWIQLDEVPRPVRPPGNIVFSTAPQRALASNGKAYIIKGGTDVAIAEALGYGLAELLDLPVPQGALCEVPGRDGVWFASAEHRTRTPEALLERDVVANRTALAQCISFDVWIANPDRNMGNLVAEPIGGRQGETVRLLAIDFEKSRVLRGVSRFEVEAMNPRCWWPTDSLGRLCAGLSVSRPFCDAIGALPASSIDGVFAQVEQLSMRRIDWAQQGVSHLTHRAQRIHSLVAEAWRA